LFGFFTRRRGQSYHGYRIDALPEGDAWQGVVTDPQGGVMQVDYLAPTKDAALTRARQTIDVLLALKDPQRRG
jgi:hypothetical protein